jgi:molybdopterin biosynthesis enzyme
MDTGVVRQTFLAGNPSSAEEVVELAVLEFIRGCEHEPIEEIRARVTARLRTALLRS